MEECNRERREAAREVKRIKRVECKRMEFSPIGSVVAPPIVSSARTVGGRRLSSCDAHNQFFCKRRRGTGVGIGHVEQLT